MTRDGQTATSADHATQLQFELQFTRVQQGSRKYTPDGDLRQ